MARKPKLSDEDKKEILKLYNKGATILSISVTYGVVADTVRKALLSLGVEFKKGPRNINKNTKKVESEQEKAIKARVSSNDTKQKTEEEESESLNLKERIERGEAIDCNTEGKGCIYRYKECIYLCNYCIITGELRGGDPHKCRSYIMKQSKNKKGAKSTSKASTKSTKVDKGKSKTTKQTSKTRINKKDKN